MHRNPIRSAWLALLLAALLAVPARATWSIVLVDKRTNEVAIGSVTCLNGYDLLRIVPVVIVGVGAAAVQAAGDFDGARRPIIHEEMLKGTPPLQILQILSGVAGHHQRQYGIVDTRGRSITFSGLQTIGWRGGVTGEVGDIAYAIQGNILAGSCVVPAMEQAVIDTPGDLAEKLMAAHIAARDTGGDGRCSCSQQFPTSCGCPPPAYDKSGHIGFMVVARIGDTDDPVCDVYGCADGDYFLKFNVAIQPPEAPDPVDQLLALFQEWRAGLAGRTDAVQSVTTIDRDLLRPDQAGTATILILPLDRQGLPPTVPIQSITVRHAPESAGITSIGPVVDNGNGTYSVTVQTRPDRKLAAEGMDRFRIVIDDGVRPVSLMPDPVLRIAWKDVPGRR